MSTTRRIILPFGVALALSGWGMMDWARTATTVSGETRTGVLWVRDGDQWPSMGNSPRAVHAWGVLILASGGFAVAFSLPSYGRRSTPP